MGCNHKGTAWSEVARVAREYVDRGLLDPEVEVTVEELLGEDEPREALEVALSHYRDRRNLATRAERDPDRGARRGARNVTGRDERDQSEERDQKRGT